MVDLTKLLIEANAPQLDIRGPAQNQLLDLEKNYLADYVNGLAKELGTNDKPEGSREYAALQLKKIFTGQDHVSSTKKMETWNKVLSPETRDLVKEACIRALGEAPLRVSKQAAQTMEAVARMQLASGEWPGLADTLVHCFDNVIARDPNAVIAPLLAIGYFARITAEVDASIEEDHINKLLTKISQGMQAECPAEVQVAAVTAMTDTLDFAKHLMNKEVERQVVMKLVLDMCRSHFPDPRYSRVREEAYNCLTTLLSMYYHHLPPYMNDIWTLTQQAIQSPEEDEGVAKQALNFWSEMALEETDRKMFRGDSTSDPTKIFHNIIETINQPLLDMVMKCLLRLDEQPEEDDDYDDEANAFINYAEFCYVRLCEYYSGDKNFTDYAFQFARTNMASPDWRNRQAAVFSFGAVVGENVSGSGQMATTVVEFVPELCVRMLVPNEQRPNGEPVVHVRETAAWALAEVCEEHLSNLQPPQVPLLISSLMEALRDKPRASHMSATALRSFCIGLKNLGQNAFLLQTIPQLNGTYFAILAQALWEAGNRDDANQWKLMEDSYEALITLIEVCPTDMNAVIQDILRFALDKLAFIDANPSVIVDREFLDVELCGVVLSCTMKLEETISQQVSNNDRAIPNSIISQMWKILHRSNSIAHPDALATMAEIARIMEGEFKCYFEGVAEIVLSGLAANENLETCKSAVRLCGDIFAAFREDQSAKELLFKPLPSKNNLSFLACVMEQVFVNLGSTLVSLELKAPHLSVLGDISETVGTQQFNPFFQKSMQVSLMACKAEVDVQDEESGDFLNTVRAAAIEAIELMIFDRPIQQELFSELMNVASLISKEVGDPKIRLRLDPSYANENVDEFDINYEVSAEVISSTVNLLGDVAKGGWQRMIKEHAQQFDSLFRACAQSQDSAIKEAEAYARKAIQL